MAKVIVLDDDPTGTQTVHSVPVLTVWDVDALAAELLDDAPAAFILTNSRALPPDPANALAREIGKNLRDAAAQTGKVFGRDFVVVSRGDSTLRGHFLGEVEALAEGMGCWVLGVGNDFPALETRLPASFSFPTLRRAGASPLATFTYIREGDKLTPVGETEFARDCAFGYQSSNLREWVEEKTDGQVPAASVVSVSLEDIREGGPERVAERLAELGHSDEKFQPSGAIQTPDG